MQIANANVFGLTTELKLKGTQYNNALVIFFVPYILFEIPSNLLLKRLKPHVWRKRLPLANSYEPVLTKCHSIALHVWFRPCDTLPRTCSRLFRSSYHPLFPGRFRIWNVSWLVGNEFRAIERLLTRRDQLLPYWQLVHKSSSSEALLALLLLYHSRRRFRRSPGVRHWPLGRKT